MRRNAKGKAPEWLDSGIFIQDDKNNPIRWCMGSDPKRPELLVVKARVNRGYGYFATTAVAPEWNYNSAFDDEALRQVWKTVADLDGTLGLQYRGLDWRR